MLKDQIKTASDLRSFIESSDHESHFFSRKNMRFAGDTMKNYGVRKVEITTNYDADGNWIGKDGVKVTVWELYRRRPVKMGLQSSAYFCPNTFRRVFQAND